MKRIAKFSTIFFFATFLLLFLIACNEDKKDNYTLSNVWVRNIQSANGKLLTFEDFNEFYPDIVSDLGKTVTIINDNEILFSGNKTKSYNGIIIYVDSGSISYITFKNEDFYGEYEDIHISKVLCIESYIMEIDGQFLKFTFQFEKVE